MGGALLSDGQVLFETTLVPQFAYCTEIKDNEHVFFFAMSAADICACYQLCFLKWRRGVSEIINLYTANNRGVPLGSLDHSTYTDCPIL